MAERAQKTKSLARTAGAVSFATLISRILGLIREMVLAKYFTVFATDAFFAAFRIPNLLRDLFAEGALSAAFVPTFTEYKQKRSREERWLLANIVLNALVVILSVVTLLILLFAKYLVLLLVSGFAQIPGKIELTVHLTRIMSPFLLTVALAAAVMGILNTYGKFFVPALAPAFFNVCSILAGIFLSPLMPRFGLEPITAMAIGSLAGGVAQLAVQIPALHRCGFRYSLTINWKHPGLQRIFRLMLPAAFGLAATQINILIDNQLASYLGNGPVSWLNYAFRLMQLPIGLFGVAIATVHLTSASQHVAANNIEGLKANLADAIKLAAFLNIPATAGLIFLRYPIVQILYERGRFTPEYTIYTGDALLCYAIGLFAYSLVKIVTPTFYALGDTKKPVQFSGLVILLKIGINLALIQKLGFLGLALGTSIASLLNTGLLLNALRKKIGSLAGHEVLSTLIRITLTSLLMGVAASQLHTWLAVQIGLDSLQQKSIVLGITIVAALALLMLLSYLFKVKEAKTILGLVSNRSKNQNKAD